jgi:hypothetical protein
MQWILISSNRHVSYRILAWLNDCQSVIIYERRVGLEVFYVFPIECILGKLPVVQVGDTGNIPFSMRRSAADFIDADFDSAEGAGDGSRWWYVNTWALGWSHKA